MVSPWATPCQRKERSSSIMSRSFFNFPTLSVGLTSIGIFEFPNFGCTITFNLFFDDPLVATITAAVIVDGYDGAVVILAQWSKLGGVGLEHDPVDGARRVDFVDPLFEAPD
ncbi:hypothetical protein SDJN03_07004, partial [Cucurbita argyrosperma subsp. sororia]